MVATGAWMNLPAMGIILLNGGLVAVGIKAAATFNDIMVVVKFLIILLFIGCGIAYMKADNLTPFIPDNTGIFGQFGFSGILRGAGVVFFAFIGFDALSTLAQEARNPQKTFAHRHARFARDFYIDLYHRGHRPLRTCQLYSCSEFPIRLRSRSMRSGSNFIWLRFVIKFLILISMTTVILVMIMGQARIFYTMAHDGLLPKSLWQDQRSFPHAFFHNDASSLFAGVVLAGLFPVGLLGKMTAMGALLAFAIVCFGVLILRYKQPTLHRPFKTPFVPWVPLAGTLVCLLQLVPLSRRILDAVHHLDG